jgi:GAF domain-containing protein
MTRDVQRWLTHLTEVSGSLTRTLDYDATLRQVVRLPIPVLADWCMLYIPDDGGPIPGRVALAHANPTKEALLRTIWQREWSSLPDEHPVVQTLQLRAPIVIEQLDRSGVHRLCAAAEHASVLERVGVQSILSLPLVAHGSVLGGVMFVLSGARKRAYGDTPLETLIKLGECYAQAIYNARQFVEARQALRFKEEVIASTRDELIQLARGIRHHPHTLHGEIERIAQRLDSAVEPYAYGLL